MEASFKASEIFFSVDLPVDENDCDTNLKIQTSIVGKSSTSDILGEEFQKSQESCLQRDTKEKSYSYDVCNKKISVRNYLKKLHDTHRNKKMHSCDVNKKEFSQSYILNRHLPTHMKDKLYSCDVCKKQFSGKSSLIIHLHTHNSEKPFSCDACRKQFSRKSSLIIHLCTRNNEKPSNSVGNKLVSEMDNLKTHYQTHMKVKPYSCDVCNKGYSDKYYLKVHLRTHTKEKLYSCDICNKQFLHQSTLKCHLRTHTNEKPFSCDVCSKAFSYKYSLQVHLRTHTKEKPYSCNVCNKGFHNKSYLQVHYSGAHSDERPFSCDVCRKKFRWKASLTIHSRTHMEEKPYSCDVCNKAFSQKHHLNRHFQKCRGKEAADMNPNRQFVIDVIKRYKELPCLWKETDPDYYNKKKRGRAMEQLLNLFKTKDRNANEDIVQRKITLLQDSYRKESNKIKTLLKSGVDTDKAHAPKLWYYNMLTFLEDQNDPRTSQTMESVLDSMPFGYDEDYKKDFNDSASAPSTSSGATIFQDPSQVQVTPQCFKLSKADKVLKKISRGVEQPFKKQPAIKQKENYNIFGEYVTEKLRSLHPNMAIYCQKLINEAIFLAERGNLNICSKIITSISNSTFMNCVTSE